MKITIKKFMELEGVTINTPAKIEAAHDVGKSTIFRAVLFAITGNGIDGKQFDGNIYPKNSTMLSDLNVEVEIEHGGVVFNKKATGSEKRQKGSSETDLQRTVAVTYSVNHNSEGGKKAYDEKINEVFGNFQLSCNPDYFRNLKTTAEKRKIFTDIVSINRDVYFSGLSSKKDARGRRDKQNELIKEKNAAIKEQSQVIEPEKIEVVDYDTQLSELRKQKEEAQPKFTELQLKENKVYDTVISGVEKSTFIPEALNQLLPEIEKPKLIDVEVLKRELEKVQLSESNTNFIDTQIERIGTKVQKINSLQLQIDNYDDNVENAKCKLCQVCAAPDCQFKQVEIEPLENLQNEISKHNPVEFAIKSIENLESQKIDYLRNFEQKKEDEILRLENEIEEADDLNDSKLFDYENEKNETEQKNTEISKANKLIQKANSIAVANFETDKAQKIAELKKQLHSLPAFDYTEVDNKIYNFELFQKTQQQNIDVYNELNGSFKFAKERIVILSEELTKLKQALYAFERDLIKIEDAENRYYSDFEAKINDQMPKNIKVSLFKKNLSNDNRSEIFEISFDGSVYAGNGKTIAFYIWLCSWFQSKFGKDLPIFIDEAIILNESLYSDVKNTVILMRNDQYKTLKIS